ncbi:MAG TPA: diacylglycerol kinase family protein [Chloroflexia bacterium]
MDKHPLEGWVMVICNPVSGSGKGPSVLTVLRRVLDREGVRYACEFSTRQGDPARLARSAALMGCSAIVAIGGDGTFFEVVNGVMEPDAANANPDLAVGLLQAGRGSDFGRSAGVPSDVEAACRRILQGRTQLTDLGHVTYTPMGGGERSRYFANAAGLGFDGAVTVRANSAPRVLGGGTLPYLTSLLATLGTYRNTRVSVRVDQDAEWHARVNSVVVANGQFFGGGMKVAPEASLSDGLFDIVVAGDLSKLDMVRLVPRVYVGTHVTHPKLRVLRGREVRVDSPDRMLLQADGEVLGKAPATFRIVPGALRLIV